MLMSPIKALLGACALLSLTSIGCTQQYAGDNVNSSLPAVPGSEVTYFNIKDPNGKKTTLINYMSLNSSSKRPDPTQLKRAIIVIHGLNRDPGTYTSNMLSALAQVKSHPEVSTDSVAILAPYFANGDDKYTGYYPWVNGSGAGKGAISSALVWKGSQWASGAENQYPSTITTVSSYYVLDQLTQYFDNKTLFPNMNQIVVAGHSLGAQTVQRYCEVGNALTTNSPVVYWIGNPNSFGWMTTDRPIDYSSCSTYDDWRDGLNGYSNSYGSALVSSGRPAVLRNYNSKKIAYARGTLDLGDDSSTCAPYTTGVNRNERFFNFINAFPPVKGFTTVDYVARGHDAGGMFASDAGQARLFLDNFDGSGSKAFDFGYPRIQDGDDPYPDPSKSSAVAPTSPGTFSGMTYQGCYSDQSPSALSLKSYSRDDNTIELCAATCAASGYKIAGLEFGRECWCGNSMNDKTRKTADQGCTMTCSGNSSELCGDSNRLSVFSTGNVTIDVQPQSPSQVGSYSLLGCYSEAKSGRALSDKSTSQTDMSVEKCALYCSGYSYFGVEYGAECYCGNTVACSSVKSLATNCRMTCSGNSTEYCGNGGYLNMYALPSVTGPSACPSSTSTSVTATSSMASGSATVTGSAISSASASSTALACPGANGTNYTSQKDQVYAIDCYIDYFAGDLATTSGSTLELCIANCDANSACVGVAWVYGACYLKSSIGRASSNNAVLGARLLRSTSSSSSSVASSSGASSSVIASALGSSTAASSAASSSLTAASSADTSSTITSSAATSSTQMAAPTAISCPASDATIFTASNGQTFLVECGIDHEAGDIGNPVYPGTFAACVSQCASTSGCVDVSYVNNGPCYLKSSLGKALTNTGIWGAKLVMSTTSSSSSIAVSSSSASSSSAPSGPAPSSANGSSSLATGTTSTVSSSSIAASTGSTSALLATTSSSLLIVTPSSSISSVSSSTSSSASSTTSASLPSGIITKGCYVDGNTRALATQIYSNSSNTPSLCATACRQQGYKYSGTEYGQECWCGPNLPITAATASDCSSTCAGDSAQKCGGGFRLSVTEDTTWQQKFFARASYGTWNLMSCYQDNVNNQRTLPASVAVGDTSSVTIAKCLDACAAKGFKYCGAEYYYECYGSAEQPADSLAVSGYSDPLLAGCNYACSGNSTEACGGANKVLVYINTGTTTQ